MQEREMLEKMDLLRSRFGISYAKAREVLEDCGWDTVEATIRLEGESEKSDFYEEIKVTGADLVETLKRLLHEGNITRILVRDEAGKEILNLPVNGMIAITLLVPMLTALGAVAAVAMNYRILVHRKP